MPLPPTLSPACGHTNASGFWRQPVCKKLDSFPHGKYRLRDSDGSMLSLLTTFWMAKSKQGFRSSSAMASPSICCCFSQWSKICVTRARKNV